MRRQPVSGIPIIEENEATGEVAQMYAQVRRELELPYIPNAAKTVAVSPAALAFYGDLQRGFQRITLPQSLISMVLYAVAKANKCKYCSATNELACRTLGIDEADLEMLIEDLPSFTPQRVRVIIEFALKVARDRQNLVEEDYQKVRAQGISDAELVQIILVAAIAVFNDIVADSLMIDVDEQVAEALGR